MNILFICHRFPFPPNRGGKIRPFNMVRHLSQKHSVTVASLAHSAEELREGSELNKYCAKVLSDVLPNSVRWMRAAATLPSAIPSAVSYFSSSRLHRQVEEEWKRTRFDVVMVHCAFAAQYAIGLQGGFRVMDFGDLDSGKWLDYSRFRRLPFSVGYGVEAKKMRRYERMVAEQFDFCTVTTAGELEEFKALGVSPDCRVIPNGVDSNYFRPLQCASSAPVIAFLGRMDYFPNVDCITYFSKAILPRIRAQVPQIELRIIGSNPVPAVRALAQLPGISVTGFVPDVRRALEGVSVGIAPLRIARGTQNKVLEFMAMGLPVVASSLAARGIQAVSGRDLLVADQPDEFSGHVVALLQNEPLRRRLSQAGRTQVGAAHNWEHSMEILDAILEQANALA